MKRSGVTTVLLVASLGVAAACNKDTIDVRNTKDTFDFGQRELLAAVAKAHETPDSPEAIAELAATIQEISGQFNESVEREAERKLVFMALGPLSARFSEPIEKQMEGLALTVWPIALQVEPHEKETPREYIARICEGALALECKNAVPEYWPTILSSVVWRRLKERAREAFVRCGPCKTEPGQSFEKALDSYRNHQTKIGAQAAIARDRAKPSLWPRSGPGAASWDEGVPLLELLRDGTAEFRGERVGSAWRRLIRERREGAETLGVHIRPTADVRTLQSILADAARSGYRFVDLQVREKEFPYVARSYRLATRRGRGQTRVAVKPADSVQILVQALDIRARAAVKSAGEPPPRTVFAL